MESVIREVQEETGLTILDPILCGIKQFPLQGGGRYVLLLFRASRFTGTLTSSAEGEVFRLPREELENCRLAPDFSEMLHVFESAGSANSIITGSRKPGNGSTVCCKRQRD